jgi:hypothetical protein
MDDRNKSQSSCPKHPALLLSSRQVVVRGAVLDWLSGQAARCRMTAAQKQRVGTNLFARMAASSLGRVSTYTSSFFLALQANSFRRGVLGT